MKVIRIRKPLSDGKVYVARRSALTRSFPSLDAARRAAVCM